MESQSVKKSVIDNYSKLAKFNSNGLFSKLFACCNPIENARAVATTIGYSQKEIEEVPDNSNLGVGCGNPSAINEINEGDTVVDLGSGAGFDAFIVSSKVGNTGKVIGIDLSEDMLALANKNAKKGNYQNVLFKKGDIEDLPLAEEIADHVISNCVINLSLRKDKVYREAFRILRKGGKLSISDIILERELPDFVKESLAGQVACVSGAEKLETYLGYIKQAGFKNIEIKSKNNFPIELMLADPQIKKIAQQLDFDLAGNEANDLASRVQSISLSATK